MILYVQLRRLRALLNELRAHPALPRVTSWLSTLCLLAVLGAYLATWLNGYWGMLADPDLQTDDARTSLFPLHRYGPERALADDPIAQEMLSFLPPGVHALYRVLVPLTGLFVATKIVQGMALAILLWAAVVMARSRRTGLAAGVLLLFLVLHDWYAIFRIAGGLPRAFGFPLFALWLAGLLSVRPWVRRSAPVLAALSYPSVMNMLLAAEGLYALRGLGRIAWSVVGRRLARYGALVGVCLIAVLPAMWGSSAAGPVHTLEQAEKEPAFGKSGRLWVLPFDRPTDVFGRDFIDQLTPRGSSIAPKLATPYRKDGEAYAVLVLALLLCLPLFRWTPPPWGALAFFCGAVVLFVLSRIFAFRLYSPDRYHSFGMRMAATALMVSVLGYSWYWLRPAFRQTARNVTAILFILGLWAFVGDGVVKNVGMTIDRKRDRPLYEHIASLPTSVRFATHPLDGDGIPLFSARATMGGFETLQPWFVDAWQRQKQRCEDTLTALYATDRSTVLDYAKKHGVTHFLINTHRYGKGFRKHAGSFEPFTTFARDLLKGVKRNELVFAQLPASAIEFRYQRWRVVSVQALEQAWSEASERP